MGSLSDNIFLYQRPEGFRPSPTMSADVAAQAAVKAGRTIIAHTSGQIEIQPPQALLDLIEQRFKESGKKLTTDSLYAPATGTPLMLEAAAHQFNSIIVPGADVKPENIFVGNGGKGVLNAIARTLAPKGAIIPSHSWPTTMDVFPARTDIIEVNTDGKGIIANPLLEELLTAVREANKTVDSRQSDYLSGVSMIVLNDNGHNPTGARRSAEEREESFGILLKHARAEREAGREFRVVVDDPYARLVITGEYPEIGANERALFEEKFSVYVRSASKEIGKPGTRVGWAVTKDEELLKGMKSYAQTMDSGASVDGQNVVAKILLFGQKEYEEFLLPQLRANAEAMMAAFSGPNAIPGVTMEMPEGAIYAWLDFAGMKGKVLDASVTLDGKPLVLSSNREILQGIVQGAGVVGPMEEAFCVPGSPFATGNHCRLGIGCSAEKLGKTIEGIRGMSEKVRDPMRLVGGSNLRAQDVGDDTVRGAGASR